LHGEVDTSADFSLDIGRAAGFQECPEPRRGCRDTGLTELPAREQLLVLLLHARYRRGHQQTSWQPPPAAPRLAVSEHQHPKSRD
jgi:hypothetical protein